MIFFEISTPRGRITRSGHIGDTKLSDDVRFSCFGVVEIQADGDELERCASIIGRTTPFPSRVFYFVGDLAQNIARNW